MNRFFLLFVSVFCGAMAANAQYVRYTVRFKDKTGSIYSLSKPMEFLSQKSIQRRARQHIAIDSSDLPVSKTYLDSISALPGVTIINTSRWLNNALVQVQDSAALERIHSLPFVVSINPVALKPTFNRPTSVNKNLVSEMVLPETIARGTGSNLTLGDSARYGLNYPQVHIHEGEFLHNEGFMGQGMTIAILDAGFRSYQTNPAFDSLRTNNQILAEYDFVNNEIDVNSDDAHGANCLSIMAANVPGKMLGTAPKASFYLFKTEDVSSEKPVEEQYWAVGAERADSAGADIISSSLGYSSFDDPALSLTYPLRDGKTAPVTVAANMAFSKGMIVTNSSGNSGNSPDDYKYVMCPADGGNVLAIGATDTQGDIASFSSGGPNGGGKMKPNVVSVGVNTVFANIHGGISTGNGTSYSNPNLAGLVACLWQAFSDFDNAEIIDALQKSSSRFLHPDQRYGYGLPNMRVAYQFLDAKRKLRMSVGTNGSYFTAYPNPFTSSFTVFFKAPATANADIKLYDFSGRLLQVQSLQVTKDGYYTVIISPQAGPSGVYLVQFDDGKNRTVIKVARL